jgi:putative endonuclease
MTNKYDKVLYVGVTNDLVRRVYEHKNKFLKGFTSRYNVTKLIYFEDYEDINQAIDREKQIKGWLRRTKIELIEEFNPEYKDLYNEILR